MKEPCRACGVNEAAAYRDGYCTRCFGISSGIGHNFPPAAAHHFMRAILDSMDLSADEIAERFIASVVGDDPRFCCDIDRADFKKRLVAHITMTAKAPGVTMTVRPKPAPGSTIRRTITDPDPNGGTRELSPDGQWSEPVVTRDGKRITLFETPRDVQAVEIEYPDATCWIYF